MKKCLVFFLLLTSSMTTLAQSCRLGVNPVFMSLNGVPNNPWNPNNQVSPQVKEKLKLIGYKVTQITAPNTISPLRYDYAMSTLVTCQGGYDSFLCTTEINIVDVARGIVVYQSRPAEVYTLAASYQNFNPPACR